MTLERLHLKRRPMHGLGMHGLLDTVGVPRVGVFKPRRGGRGVLMRTERRGGFWKRNADLLGVILHDIFACYRRTIRRVHQDMGGDHETAVAVNQAWAKIKRLFAKRGITLN